MIWLYNIEEVIVNYLINILIEEAKHLISSSNHLKAIFLGVKNSSVLLMYIFSVIYTLMLPISI